MVGDLYFVLFQNVWHHACGYHVDYNDFSIFYSKLPDMVFSESISFKCLWFSIYALYNEALYEKSRVGLTVKYL